MLGGLSSNWQFLAINIVHYIDTRLGVQLKYVESLLRVVSGFVPSTVKVTVTEYRNYVSVDWFEFRSSYWHHIWCLVRTCPKAAFVVLAHFLLFWRKEDILPNLDFLLDFNSNNSTCTDAVLPDCLFIHSFVNPRRRFGGDIVLGLSVRPSSIRPAGRLWTKESWPKAHCD